MESTKEAPKEDSELKCEPYYSNLVSSLRLFFNLRIFLMIFSSLAIILWMNQISNIRAVNYEFSVSQHTKEHINHFFFEVESQAKFISKTVNKIVRIQYDNYKESNSLYYMQRDPLTKVQKMVFQERYGTTGEYKCLNGDCKSIQFYLVNLWAKRNYYNSFETVYIQYFDPIENSTNIVYTPMDQNKLSEAEIEKMMENVTKYETFEKIGDNLYFKIKFQYKQSFNSSYQISMAIGLKKQEIEKILKSDIQLNRFYQFSLSDTANWISLETAMPLPRFAYQTGETVSEVSYVSVSKNQTLITFSFRIPQVKLLFDFMKISVFLPVLILFLHFFKQRKIYGSALDKCFRSTATLISLYEFNIQQIFTGKTPKHSTILNDTTSTQFYQELSQIPSTQYEPITQSSKVKVPRKQFMFPEIMKMIVEKYNEYAKGIFRQKNKEIISNKFFIHSSVNEISESESLKIKEAFTKAKQLGFVKRFFYFAYLSLLLNPREFDKLIEQDKSALPQEHIKLTREINRTVSSTDVRKAFKLSPHTRKETQEELEMRIQINLLHKYLQILKDLDIHNNFAKELQLEDDLENITNYIQNIKHVLNKHNKNIRTYGK